MPKICSKTKVNQGETPDKPSKLHLPNKRQARSASTRASEASFASERAKHGLRKSRKPKHSPNGRSELRDRASQAQSSLIKQTNMVIASEASFESERAKRCRRKPAKAKQNKQTKQITQIKQSK